MKGIRWAQAAVTRNPNNLAPHSLARAQHQPHDTLKRPFLSLGTEQGTDKHLFITYMFGDGLATWPPDRHIVCLENPSFSVQTMGLCMLSHEVYQSAVRRILPLPAHLLLRPSGHPTLGKMQSNVSLAHFVQLTQLESSLEVPNEIQMAY